MALKVFPSENPVAALVLAPGAGAGSSSPFMVRAASGLAARGISTATFDFQYVTSGRRVPDRPAVLEERWRHAMAAAGPAFEDLPLFIGGKSMGGRIASQVAAQGCDGIAGLVFLGYPLHPPGRPEQRRDAHLPSVAVPMLFVQGSRDTFGTAAEIRALLPSLTGATLHEVAGGDHSLKVGGRGAPAPDDVLSTVLEAIRDWIVTSIAAAEGRAQPRPSGADWQ